MSHSQHTPPPVAPSNTFCKRPEADGPPAGREGVERGDLYSGVGHSEASTLRSVASSPQCVGAQTNSYGAAHLRQGDSESGLTVELQPLSHQGR